MFGRRKRPVDCIDKAGIKDVFYMEGYYPISKLGDSIIQLRRMTAVRETFPNAALNVFNGNPAVFEGSGIEAVGHEGYERALLGSGGGMLLVRWDPNYAMPGYVTTRQYLSKGNCLLALGITGCRLYSREHDGREFRYTNPILDDPEAPVYAQDDAKLSDLGFCAAKEPRIILSESEARDAEGMLGRMGLHERGRLLRVFFNPFTVSDKKAAFSHDESIAAVSHILGGGDAEVVLNAGMEEDFDTARRIRDFLKRDKLFLQARDMPTRSFIAMLSRFDMVVTPDTGVMHASNAVGVPLTVARFSEKVRARMWPPPGDRVLPYIEHENGMELIKTFDAARLLLAGRGMQAFTDCDKGASLARKYVEGVNSIRLLLRKAHKDARSLLEDMNHELSSITAEGYGFMPLEIDYDRHPNTWLFSHLQNPMYRFCAQLVHREETRTHGPILPLPKP